MSGYDGTALVNTPVGSSVATRGRSRRVSDDHLWKGDLLRAARALGPRVSRLRRLGRGRSEHDRRAGVRGVRAARRRGRTPADGWGLVSTSGDVDIQRDTQPT